MYETIFRLVSVENGEISIAEGLLSGLYCRIFESQVYKVYKDCRNVLKSKPYR